MYKLSKKKAARSILDNTSPTYSGTVTEAEQFFTEVFDDKSCDTDALSNLLTELVPQIECGHNLDSLISPDEYKHLRSIDPKGEILAKIFNRCLTDRNIPAQWKESNTILIHKKGDASCVSNFRPIALMSCVYKLLTSIIASRLVSFSIDNGLLSDSQKSARPNEGCYEHTFILQSLILDAKRHQKNIYLAWLDLKNAFGSVPHNVISTTLKHLGVPNSLVELIISIYKDATTTIITSNGNTKPIPILAGVKQGCPLSPILFNLCIEIILRGITSKNHQLGPVKHHSCEISVLAYADDLVVLAKNEYQLQSLLNSASNLAYTIGLEFRPDKCASLAITYSKRVIGNIQPSTFIVQDKQIPHLAEEEHYRYLGIPIGLIRDFSSIQNLTDNLCRDLECINNSLLAPWQKLDMIKTFIQPCLTYALRRRTKAASLINYRKKLIEVVRSICNLPLRATTHYIFSSIKSGGLGLQDPAAEVDVQTVVQAIKMLSSSDKTVANIAKQEILRTVSFASRSDPSPALIKDFLSGSTTGCFHKDVIRYRTHSLWTRTRNACRNLNITFAVPPNDQPAIFSTNKGPCTAKAASAFLHQHVQNISSTKLLNLPDQGKVASTLNRDCFGNGSKFLNNGLNMRFSDWRFIHKARLNVVPVNQNKSKWNNTSSSCRKCHDTSETLPHILNHCNTNMVNIRKRHDQIVDRLVNATRSGTIKVDQQVDGIEDECRPDIVIEDGNNVTIIDVTCPFENGTDALSTADFHKITKYEHVKRYFQSTGKSCSVHGFVIGSLGAWHPNNEVVLSKLNMSNNYKSLFRKLCCTDVIRGSADIYYDHVKYGLT
ncbi:uncharacterized protein LOC124449153 [Xenia sp. Carnegie-2017]|uniref:uncharacterized protein LOC124449153 n=1 Tax=Xenia sp. Carnegie-2017 TaxID=2897299 RepID=UPI001F04AE0D|nr:uncharacterized protein LOC124449153 [Xenia sp. Carnegie-2017]